jgi:hypothetical protein
MLRWRPDTSSQDFVEVSGDVMFVVGCGMRMSCDPDADFERVTKASKVGG